MERPCRHCETPVEDYEVCCTGRELDQLIEAWFEMRDEFECGRWQLTKDDVLKVIDSYETSDMAQIRKERDRSDQ